MKWHSCATAALAAGSHPSRGEWIEIILRSQTRPNRRSHPSRGEWIEILIDAENAGIWSRSHPSRGEWIEIKMQSVGRVGIMVSPLAG